MTLPLYNFDILAHIVDTLADQPNYGSIITTTLQALSLTCRAMVPLCRKHLFATVSLADNEERAALLESLISKDPTVILYVKCMICHISNPISIHTLSILDTLKNQTILLRQVHLHPISGRIEWDTLPASSQMLLEQLIQLPSVTRIYLSNMRKVPTTIFNSGNLTQIVILDVKFTLAHGFGEVRSSSRITRPILLEETQSGDAIRLLMQLRRTPHSNDHCNIDFTGLQNIACDVYNPIDAERVWLILQMSPEVKILHLHVPRHVPLVGIGEALTSVNLQKLTIWREGITDRDLDPLCGIVDELKSIAKSNLNDLEGITFRFIFHIDQLSPTIMDTWTSFDTLLTTSGFFPKLKLVSIQIEWPCDSGASADVMRDGITANHFPKLWKDKTKDFNFSTRVDCWCGRRCQSS